jgi:hypothetical protein
MEFPGTLVERLRTQKLIPFVGAGVSMAVRCKRTKKPLFPSWRELLVEAAARLDREKKQREANLVRAFLDLDTPDYMEAARYAEKALGPIWLDFLRGQFNHTKAKAEKSSLELARACWDLNCSLVITTNYDRVLRWTCPEAGDVSVWNIQSPYEQGSFARNGSERSVIWHLHGNIEEPDRIILTPDSYRRLYPQGKEETESQLGAAILTLRSLLTSHSLLFVGFSLDDEAFGLQLRAVCELFAGSTGPHYALIHRRKAESVRIPGVEVIPFEDYGQPLVDTLRALRRLAGEDDARALPMLPGDGSDSDPHDESEWDEAPPSPVQTRVILDDPWADPNPNVDMLMTNAGRVYNAHHASTRFKYSDCTFQVIAYSLLDKSDPASGSLDCVEYRSTFEALHAPISCVSAVLLRPSGHEYIGRTKWRVTSVETGKELTLISLPIKNPDCRDDRELVQYFEQPILPGTGKYTLWIRDEARDLMADLVSTGTDQIEFAARRAIGTVGRITLVVHVPQTCHLELSRLKGSPRGWRMSPAELREFEAPVNFHTYGWAGKNVKGNGTFGTVLTRIQ